MKKFVLVAALAAVSITAAGLAYGREQTAGKDGEEKFFVRLAAVPADWAGEYLIVYETASLAFDGSRGPEDPKLDAGRNFVPVIITPDKRIPATAELLKSTFTIETDSTGCFIKSKSGYYIGAGSARNSLTVNASNAKSVQTLGFDAAGNFVAETLYGNILQYNANAGDANERFRYYMPARQKPVQLYKLEPDFSFAGVAADTAAAEETSRTRESAFKSQEQSVVRFKTWLSNYEIPATDALAVSEDDACYNGVYSHDTFNETYGPTKACRYNTAEDSQKVVTHTYSYNGKVVRNYSMLFDKDKKAALWVAFAISGGGDFEDNKVRRNDAWAYDPALEKNWQPNLSGAYTSSALRYDRGHQTASNDHQTTVDQNRQTFYYSNMTPQLAVLNRGQWRQLEDAVQGVGAATTGKDTLYVVTGPLFEDDSVYATDKSGVQCPVPTGYWKCLMKCTFSAPGVMSGAVGCAYLFDSNSLNTAPSVTTIDAIEDRTGFDLFANVPDLLQTAAEATSYTFF